MSKEEPIYTEMEKRFITLCKAAYRGSVEDVTKSLKLKVLPNCQDPSNVAKPTPLHYAALRGA
jgi:hypothetical protein